MAQTATPQSVGFSGGGGTTITCSGGGANRLVYYTGSGVACATVPTAAQVLLFNASGVPTPTTISGDVSLSNTGTATLTKSTLRNVSGSTDTLLSSDCTAIGNTVAYTNAGNVAVTLPQPGASFPAGCQVRLKNVTASGYNLTLTPTSSTIDGKTSAQIAFPSDGWIVSDGTNWRTMGANALGCAGLNCYYGMPRFRSAIERVRRGVGNAKIGFLGDSLFFGTGADTGLPTSVSTDTITNNLPVNLCTIISKDLNVPCQWQSWFGQGNSTGIGYANKDPRISVGSSWTADNGLARSFGGVPWVATTSTNALTFTPATNYDTVEVYYIQQPGGGILNVVINGVTTPINTAGTAGLAKTTITTTLGTNVIAHTWASGGPVDLVGEVAYDSTTPSVLVLMAGMGGSKESDWAAQTSAWSTGNAAPYIVANADLWLHEGGDNDALASVTPSTFASQAQTIVSAILSAGSDVALVTPVPPNPAQITTSTMSALMTSFRGVATANSNNYSSGTLPFSDTITSWGSYSASNGIGLMSDGLHPNAPGYKMWAPKLAADIFGISTVSGSRTSVDWFLSPHTSGSNLISNITQFVPTVKSGAYSLTCRDGWVFDNTGTVTLPNLGSAYNGCHGVVQNYGAGVINLSVVGTNVNVPAQLGVNSSIQVGYQAGSWYWLGGNMTLTGTSASIGGSSLPAGTCTAETVVSVVGVNAFTQVPIATPTTYGAPGDGMRAEAVIKASGQVGLKVCNYTSGALTPTASTYAVRVLQ